MNLRTIAAIAVALALAGCCEEERVPMGIVRGVDFRTSSFNSADATVVTTDTRVLILDGRWSFLLNRELYFVKGRCQGKKWEQ